MGAMEELPRHEGVARPKALNLASHQTDHLTPKLQQSLWRANGVESVGPDAHAEDVVNLVERTQANIVLIRDGDRVIGILSPEHVVRQANRYSGRAYRTLREYVESIEGDPEEQVHGFHHEYLNQPRLDLYKCTRCGWISTEPTCGRDGAPGKPYAL